MDTFFEKLFLYTFELSFLKIFFVTLFVWKREDAFCDTLKKKDAFRVSFLYSSALVGNMHLQFGKLNKIKINKINLKRQFLSMDRNKSVYDAFTFESVMIKYNGPDLPKFLLFFIERFVI